MYVHPTGSAIVIKSEGKYYGHGEQFGILLGVNYACQMEGYTQIIINFDVKNYFTQERQYLLYPTQTSFTDGG